MELTGGEDRGEKNRDEKAKPSHHGSDTSYSPYMVTVGTRLALSSSLT